MSSPAARATDARSAPVDPPAGAVPSRDGAAAVHITPRAGHARRRRPAGPRESRRPATVTQAAAPQAPLTGRRHRAGTGRERPASRRRRRGRGPGGTAARAVAARRAPHRPPARQRPPHPRHHRPGEGRGRDRRSDGHERAAPRRPPRGRAHDPLPGGAARQRPPRRHRRRDPRPPGRDRRRRDRLREDHADPEDLPGAGPRRPRADRPHPAPPARRPHGRPPASPRSWAPSWATRVGWKVRFTDQVGENTLVKLMTDGILLAELTRRPDAAPATTR